MKPDLERSSADECPGGMQVSLSDLHVGLTLRRKALVSAGRGAIRIDGSAFAALTLIGGCLLCHYGHLQSSSASCCHTFDSRQLLKHRCSELASHWFPHSIPVH